jgi:hypothetical protein
MLYLAIDQHSKQLTVEDRNEGGDVTGKRHRLGQLRTRTIKRCIVGTFLG